MKRDNLTKQQQLQDLIEKIMADDPTTELREQATQLVFGDGSPEADILFIGEAPGKNEDLQGKPFVGAAGKFLDEMLNTIGLERNDVYITNIVKYRPPNNRDPLPEEKAAFLPYLKKQIETIKPKLIVTLGRHSMECLLPGFKISEVHGQPKRIKLLLGSGDIEDGNWQKDEKANPQPVTPNHLEVVILPFYHPAAALYNGDMRQTLIDDFSKIPAVLELLEGTN